MHRTTIYFTRHSTLLRDACQVEPGAASGIGVGEVSDLPTYLVDESSVFVTERDGEARYRLPEKVRPYGRRWLQAALSKGEAPESIRANLHWAS
jgi:hypothetical protein